MSYIYDVLVNFHKEVKEFYEWDKNDVILPIRRCPILKVATSCLKNLYYNEIRVEQTLLDMIENKTEIFQNKNGNYHFIAIFTDSFASICIQFDEKGEILGRSLLQMEEEEEVLDSSERMKTLEFSYDVLREVPYNPFSTQREKKKENYIHKMFHNFEKNENFEKLKYIYYDCFEEKSENKKEMIKRFQEELNKQNSKIQDKLYDFFQLISSHGVK